MKNREKYKNELRDVIKKDGKLCEFVKRHEVFRMFGKDSISYCKMTCVTCGAALQLWLDEEYKEPEVDWDNVPVDTLVRVRNSEDDKWLLRYFHLYCEDEVALKYNRKYKTFHLGATRKTCMYPDESWRYCELVEDEDNDK